MKNAFYSISVYAIAALLGFSFYFTLFNLFAFSPVIGIGIVGSIAMIAFIMFTDGEFIADIEE